MKKCCRSSISAHAIALFVSLAASVSLAQTSSGNSADIEINPQALDALGGNDRSATDSIKPPPVTAAKPVQTVILPKVHDRGSPAFSLPYDANQPGLPETSRKKLAGWIKTHISTGTQVRIRALGLDKTASQEDGSATLTTDPVHLAVRTAYLHGLEVQKFLVKAGVPRDRITLAAGVLAPDDRVGLRIDIYIDHSVP